jgi:glycolate oxidase
MIPAAMEMMDRLTLQAAEAGLQCGYPSDAGAVLLLELDGLPEVVGPQASRARAECLERGAKEVREASSARERELLWKGRRRHRAPAGSNFTSHGVVPRSRLVDVMARVSAISDAHGLQCANVFHAGDGNLHPLILFDERIPGTKERVLAAGAEIMRACVDAGGSLSGEHGIGFEKQQFMPWLYSETDLEHMGRIRAVFGNEGDFNPCKLLPAGTGCGEMAHQEQALRAAGPDAYV